MSTWYSVGSLTIHIITLFTAHFMLFNSKLQINPSRTSWRICPIRHEVCNEGKVPASPPTPPRGRTVKSVSITVFINTEVCSLQQGCPPEPANSSLRKSVHNDIPYYTTLVLMLITQVIKGTEDWNQLMYWLFNLLY